MNRHPRVCQDRANRLGGHLSQVPAALSQAIQKFSSYLVCRDQTDISQRRARTDYLHSILIVRVKYCAPI